VEKETLGAKFRRRARQLKTDIPAVFLALRRKETPLVAKLLAGLTVAYALSPVDLIPDFIPVLGFLDDVLILPGMVALVVRLIPGEVFAECRQEAESLWTDGKPKKWYFAVPILLVWGLLVFLVVRAIWF
jgi:uncharacterized membrane protein YkvA (DUF1232 family)